MKLNEKIIFTSIASFFTITLLAVVFVKWDNLDKVEVSSYEIVSSPMFYGLGQEEVIANKRPLAIARNKKSPNAFCPAKFHEDLRRGVTLEMLQCIDDGPDIENEDMKRYYEEHQPRYSFLSEKKMEEFRLEKCPNGIYFIGYRYVRAVPLHTIKDKERLRKAFRQVDESRLGIMSMWKIRKFVNFFDFYIEGDENPPNDFVSDYDFLNATLLDLPAGISPVNFYYGPASGELFRKKYPDFDCLFANPKIKEEIVISDSFYKEYEKDFRPSYMESLEKEIKVPFTIKNGRFEGVRKTTSFYKKDSDECERTEVEMIPCPFDQKYFEDEYTSEEKEEVKEIQDGMKVYVENYWFKFEIQAARFVDINRDGFMDVALLFTSWRPCMGSFDSMLSLPKVAYLTRKSKDAPFEIIDIEGFEILY